MSVNFTLPEMYDKRKPSVFAAMFLYMLATAGLLLAPLVAYPLSFLFSLLFPNITLETLNCISQAVYFALFLLLPIVLYVKKHPSSAVIMRINPISAKEAAWCVLAAVIGMFFVLYISFIWSILIEVFGGSIPDSGITLPKTAGGMLPMIIVFAVMTGVSEELLFRGVMLGAWEQKGSLRAMIISSMWFTFLHASIEGIPAQFISGLILSFVVISTNSIFAGMIYHTVYNAANLILSFSVSNAAVQEAVVVSGTTLESIGGAMGLFIVFMYILFLGALLLFVLKRIDAIRIRSERFEFGYAPMARREFDIKEVLLITICAISIFMLYMVNLLEIAGVIA